MIVLFTDFGPSGPYVGQMMGVLLHRNPGIPVVDLLSDAPNHDPRAAAYLLAPCAREFPEGTVFLCVVDPGVGGRRSACAVRIDGRWFIGPDNGLFNVVAMNGGEVQWWEITWRPERLSATFHGRDLFAPIAARIAGGEEPPGVRCDSETRIDRTWMPDYPAVLYIDHFGNAITGLDARHLDRSGRLRVGEYRLRYARNFEEAGAGRAFWYENSIGLVEIAVGRGNARAVLDLKPGDSVYHEGPQPEAPLQ